MELIFRDDAYARSCDAVVTSAGADGIRLDRTVFYPMGGGQPGDSGRLVTADGRAIAIADSRKGADHEDAVLIPAEGEALPEPGTGVTAEIDWDRRYRHMRMHTLLHLLSAVVPGEITGGQVGAEKSRLDVNWPDFDSTKEAIAAELNRLIEEDHPVASRWIGDDELAARPELVKTMSVKPPTGAGRVRLLEIEGGDLQPCGGTHVRRTGEIGRCAVAKIENKGRQNRRVVVTLEA